MRELIRKYATTLFVFVLLLFSNLYTLGYEFSLSRDTIDLTYTMLPSIYHVSSMSTDVSDYQIHELRHLLTSDSLEMSRQEAGMRLEEESYAKHERAYLTLMVSDEEMRLFERAKTIHDEYLSVSKKMVAYSRENRKEEAYRIFRQKLLSLDDTLTACFDKLVDVAMKNASRTAEQAIERYETSRWIALSVILGCVVAVLSWIFAIEYFARITRSG
jgi:hypothetical protein